MRSIAFYAASFLVHVGIAAYVVDLRPPVESSPVVITLKEYTPPKPPPPPPIEPPKPPPEPPKVAAPAPRPHVAKAPPPPKAAPPPPAAAAAPVQDFGVQLSGSSGPGGIAVPTAPAPVAPAPKRVVAKSLAAAPVAAADTCTDPPAKPKPVAVSQPAYPEAARAAGIQGKVRVKLTVDMTGHVTEAIVVEGLGHGLDEAAIEAAKSYQFEPALRCGRAVAATFTIAIRFTI